MSESYPSPDSDKDAASSAASTPAKTSPATDRDTKSCEPVSAHAQQLGNHRRKTHSPEAWEAVKADIRRLYLDENRRLKVSLLEPTPLSRVSQARAVRLRSYVFPALSCPQKAIAHENH